jgi:2-polyprenyl-6-methoxyphenol hydroxylase-like FAD-dependent oxidoreductase
MTFAFPPGELALVVPMAPGDDGRRRGAPRAQFSWFRPTDSAALADLCTDANGRRHGLSIPPPLIRSELIVDLRAQASAMLPPQLLTAVTAGRPLAQPIFDLESRSLVFGRALLLGDAAFVARPHVGTGVTKAALDAQCLADALRSTDGDLDGALHRYDHERLAFGRRLVARGRYLGEWLSAFHEPGRNGARNARARDPLVVMRELGAAGEMPRVASAGVRESSLR